MGWLNKVKRFAPFIAKEAIAATQAANGDVQGAVATTVDAIQQHDVQSIGQAGTPVVSINAASPNAVKAVAVAVDDLHARLTAAETQNIDLRAQLAAVLAQIGELKQALPVKQS